MKLLIKQKTAKGFQGEDGEEVKYFWYVALNKETGFTIKFGSTDGTKEKGKEYEVDIMEDTTSNGNKILKEVVLREE